MTERKEKFTPGPWSYDKYLPVEWKFNSPGQYGYRIQYGQDGEEICERVYEGADAALISAAPEMYKLLDHIEDVMDDSSGCGEIPVDKIREVLKKARDEE